MLASQVFFRGRIACPDLSGELACFRLRRIMDFVFITEHARFKLSHCQIISLSNYLIVKLSN